MAQADAERPKLCTDDGRGRCYFLVDESAIKLCMLFGAGLGSKLKLDNSGRAQRLSVCYAAFRSIPRLEGAHPQGSPS